MSEKRVISHGQYRINLGKHSRKIYRKGDMSMYSDRDVR